ncbi:MAG: hypothetical protein K1W35_10825, partial [Lachnospiraceae bacterium]
FSLPLVEFVYMACFSVASSVSFRDYSIKFYHIRFIRTTCTPAFIPLVLAKPTLLTIHFREHRAEVVKHPPLQHFLYKFSDFVNDRPHEL